MKKSNVQEVDEIRVANLRRVGWQKPRSKETEQLQQEMLLGLKMMGEY